MIEEEVLFEDEPIYKSQDGQIVTKSQLIESGYSQDRINKGVSNKILSLVGDTKNPEQTFKSKDGQTITTKQLIESGYSQDRIDKGVHNGILMPLEPTVKKKVGTVNLDASSLKAGNALQDGALNSTTNTTDIEDDDITKVLTANQLENATKTVRGTGMSAAMDATREVQDEEKLAQAVKLKSKIKEGGLDDFQQKRIVDEWSDMPEGVEKLSIQREDGTIEYPYSKQSLSKLRKENYLSYLDKTNALKTYVNIKNELGTDKANEFARLQYNKPTGDYYIDAQNFEEGKLHQQDLIINSLSGGKQDKALKRLDENREIWVAQNFDADKAKDYLNKKLLENEAILPNNNQKVYAEDSKYNGNINDYTPDAIRKYIDPHNKTEQLIFQKYKTGYDLNDVISSSKDFNEAAIKFAAKQNPVIQDQIDRLGEINLPENMKGELVSAFLDNPDVIDLSKKDPKVFAEYTKAKNSLAANYPDFNKKRISTLISQERENKGLNNWFANVPGQESTDAIVEDLFKKGELLELDKNVYETKIKPEIGVWQSIKRGVARVPFGAFVDESPIHTPGFLENTQNSFNRTVHGIARSLEDVHSVVHSTPKSIKDKEDDNRLYSILQENSNVIPFVPKGKLHEVSEGTGNLAGFIIPMMAGSGIFNGIKGGELINNALMFEGANRDKALTEFPNDPTKRFLYTSLATGIDLSVAHLIPIDKIDKGVSKVFKTEIKGVVNDLASGSITQAAAKESLLEKGIKFLPKLLKENAKTSAVMTSFGVFHNTLDSLFGVNDMSAADIAYDAVKQYKSTFLTTPLLAAASAYGKNNKVNGKVLWEIGGNEETYRKILDEKLKLNPESTEIKEQIQNLDNLVSIRNDLEKVRIPEERKHKYLISSLNESIWKKKASEVKDDLIKQKYLDKSEKFRLEKEAIYKGEDKAEDFKNYDTENEDVPVTMPNRHSAKKEDTTSIPKEADVVDTKLSEPVEGLNEDANKILGLYDNGVNFDLFDNNKLRQIAKDNGIDLLEGAKNVDIIEVLKNKRNELANKKNEAQDVNESIGTDDNTETILATAEKKGGIYAQLAKAVKNLLGGVKTTVYKNLSDFAKHIEEQISTHGAYDESTKTIHINNATDKNKLHIFFHEVLHHITIDKIKEFEKNPNSKNLTPSEFEAILNLKRIFKQISEKANKDRGGFGKQSIENSPTNLWMLGERGTDRGFANVHEFISEAFTNPEFQKILKGFKGEGKSPNLFKQFLDAVAKMLGLKDPTILDDIFHHTEKLIENKKPKEKSLSKNEQSIPIIESQNAPADPLVSSKEVSGIRKEEMIGITHEQTDAVARELGLPEYEEKPETIAQWDAEVDKRLSENKDAIPEMLDKYRKGGKIDKYDQRMMLKYHAALKDRINKNPTSELLKEYNEAKRLSDIEGGREVAKSLVARKGMSPVEDNLANYLADEANAHQINTLPQEQITDLKNKFEADQEVQRKLKEATDRISILEKELQAKKEFDKIKKSSAKTKKTHDDFIKERKQIAQSISEKLKKARSETNIIAIPYAKELIAIAPDVLKLAKSHVEEGILKLADVIEKIHNELKSDIPDVTKDDIRDIIAGEYTEKKKTRNEIAAQMRDLKMEAVLAKKLEKLMEGEKSIKDPIKKQKRNEDIEELKNKIKEFEKSQKEDEKLIDDLESDLISSEEKRLKIKGKESEALSKKIDKELAKKTPEDIALQTIKTRLKNKIDKLKKDLETGDYLKEPEIRKPVKLDKEAQDLLDEHIKFVKETKVRRQKAEFENRTRTERWYDKVMQVLGLKRLVQTAVDLSIPLRQGVTLAFNPRRWKTFGHSFKAMMQSVFSQKKMDRLMYEIQESPNYKEMVQDGIVFNDMEASDPQQRNEDFQKSFIYKIPVLREPLLASNRAADAFLNTSRYEMYMKGKDMLEKQGITRENGKAEYEALAKWAMNMTGRGNMLKFIEASHSGKMVASNTFFGARLMASRFNLLNPIYYTKMPKAVRVEALKDIGTYVGMITTTLLAASAAGAKVVLNPDDPDFLKIKIGDTKYDISGGMVQYVRTFLRIEKAIANQINPNVSQEDANKYSKFAAGSVSNFFRYKLAPNTSYGLDAFLGKNALGKPFDPKDALKIYPMYIDDMVDGWNKQGALSLLTIGLPSILGMGVQTYEEKGSEGEIESTAREELAKEKEESKLSDEERKKRKDAQDIKDEEALIKSQQLEEAIKKKKEELKQKEN